ncbi:hypothetical protein BIV57_00695 [Mangrovactinospora gilvigrisea]|uniref:Mycothiol-dependent maleylpyruvate isomerase metal-binding domain-containing protein n=1 Tax=Mangrovactinospora gilvigrisea TaxID=1428644 RepID=A0A1J7CIQ2_9ACTN|nr:maleylpyruvate isomerase family mycothiol-dependent enzyme [Mangrovactinospora gilvigrisea]OIV39514.1 hypothetical protein BIV57_00695 [Mangrovactinospora gilvigrisea]
MTLAAAEYARGAALLESLEVREWALPTECPPWDVRSMATHLLGYMRACASVREQLRQVRVARAHGGAIADAMSDLQVRELSALSPEEITAEMRALLPRAVAGRRRVPAPLRHLVRIASDLPVAGTRERWSLGYVVDVIGTRDCWMHRIDICRATGRAMELTADHDGVLVANVAADWAQRHERPVRLTLTGPAGGDFAFGDGGPAVSYDAVEFCRALSGRGGDEVPFGKEVPF